MRISDIVRLLTLAAIWGGSFIFMRVIAPVMGAIPTANARVLIAGIVLCTYFLIAGIDLGWKKNWKQYLIIGMVASGIPFSLFAYGAIHIPASYEVILNSTAPLFGAVFSWLWLGDQMNLQKVIGLIIAAVGVAIVVNLGQTDLTTTFILSVLACLLASICYGLAAIYIKKFTRDLKPIGIAGGSQLMVGLAMLPLSLSHHVDIHAVMNMKIILCILGLALICSMTAYLLYYRLLADIGATRALSVTFLMPVFGMIWGAIFLGETITPQMIFGTITIVLGTWLTVKGSGKKSS
jgi:drug/metabolite transporter (DMT)-like permease